MKDANCDLVRFGVETATDRIKKKVLKRDFSEKKTEEVFKYCRKIGLRTFAFNILANPTETREEMKATLALNTRLMPDGLKVSLGYPYPGTEYHKIAKDMDLIDETRHYHNFIHDTKLKWSDEDRLWIDKVRAVFWWWMNITSRQRGLAALQGARHDARSDDRPTNGSIRKRNGRCGISTTRLSNMLKLRGITHYTIPFKDRPEISILHLGADRALQADVLDQH